MVTGSDLYGDFFTGASIAGSAAVVGSAGAVVVATIVGAVVVVGVVCSTGVGGVGVLIAGADDATVAVIINYTVDGAVVIAASLVSVSLSFEL